MLCFRNNFAIIAIAFVASKTEKLLCKIVYFLYYGLQNVPFLYKLRCMIYAQKYCTTKSD